MDGRRDGRLIRGFPRALPVLALVAAAGLLALRLPALAKALRSFPADGLVDWAGARSFWAGENLYDPEVMARYGIGTFGGGVGHPPTTFVWFLPLAPLDPMVMNRVLGVAVILLLAVHVALVYRELAWPRPGLAAGVVFTATLASPWMIDHLAHGQISELIAVLYVLAWSCLRRGHERAAGVFVGAACTLKLFPGALLLFLAVTRRFRALGAAVLTYGAVVALVTARFGLRAWVQFFEHQSGIAELFAPHVRNASLNGIVLRLIAPSCEPLWGPGSAGFLVGAGFCLAALVAACVLARRAPARGLGFDLWFALFSVVSFFVNAWVWEHYNVLLLLPLAVAFREALRDGTRAEWIALVGTVVLLLAVPVWPKVWLVNRSAILTAGQHLLLHVLEVANWLPIVVTLVVLGRRLRAYELRRLPERGLPR